MAWSQGAPKPRFSVYLTFLYRPNRRPKRYFNHFSDSFSETVRKVLNTG
jgi:hypothetical protein